MGAIFRDVLASPGRLRDSPIARAMVVGSAIALLTVVVGPKPFKQTEWPQPKPPKAVSQSIAQPARSLPLVTFRQTFKQTEWPLANIPRPVAQPTAVSSRSLSLITAQTLPARPLDWPLPRTVRLEPSDEALPDSLALGTVVVSAAPFASFDWPLAERLPSRSPLNIETNRTVTVDVVTPPFASFDWPLAERLPPRSPESLPLNIAALRSVVVSAPPFANFDWPLAGRLQRSAPETPSLNIVALRTIIVGAKPFASFDWPVPSLGGKFTSMRQLEMQLGVSLAINSSGTPPSTPGSEYVYYAMRHSIRS